MEIRVEGRWSVGRPRKKWLKDVESGMAELRDDRENVHDGNKWRRNVMMRESNHRKTDYTPILIIDNPMVCVTLFLNHNIYGELVVCEYSCSSSI